MSTPEHDRRHFLVVGEIPDAFEWLDDQDQPLPGLSCAGAIVHLRKRCAGGRFVSARVAVEDLVDFLDSEAFG